MPVQIQKRALYIEGLLFLSSHEEGQEAPTNNQIWKHLYCHYSIKSNGHVGRGCQEELPKHVVDGIRNLYPDSSGVYHGFHKADIAIGEMKPATSANSEAIAGHFSLKVESGTYILVNNNKTPIHKWVLLLSLHPFFSA